MERQAPLVLGCEERRTENATVSVIDLSSAYQKLPMPSLDHGKHEVTGVKKQSSEEVKKTHGHWLPKSR